MPSTRRLVLLALLPALIVLIAPVRGAEEDALVAAKTLRLIEKAAKDLAASGHAEEMRIALDVIEGLGRKPSALNKARKACDKAFARSKPSASKRKSAVKNIGKAVTALTEVMESASLDDQERLASAILRLDGSIEEAHEMLEHEQVDGAWHSKEKLATLDAATTIRGILLRARNRVFFLEQGRSEQPVYDAVHGEKANKVSWENIEVHGLQPHARLERMLREVLRAASVSREIRQGTYELKKRRKPIAFLLFNSQVSYEGALKDAVARGTLATDRLAAGKELCGAWLDPGKTMAIRLNAEMPALAIMLYHVSDWHGSKGRRVQPTLRAGHLNWICLNWFGVPMPGVGWIEETGKLASGASATAQDRREFERKHKMAKAGIVGCRSWMVYLAKKRLDPAWSETMTGVIGKLRGTPLLKATMVVAYLQEIGKLADVMSETGRPETKGEVQCDPTIFEAAVDGDLTEFENRWRAWLLPPDPGLVARLNGGVATAAARPDTLRALRELDRIRSAAFKGRKLGDYEPLIAEPELSAGALAHARYLNKHPEQLAAWPDAHEEWPDREGFSVAGSSAGLRSVITPDARTPEVAIAGWMATFYHRIPLIDPGLFAIGWGSEKGIGVLDSGSLVKPRYTDEVFVVWPHDGQKNVPLRFRSELPNPVPGESQAAWGYPITIQGGLYDPTLTFALYQGKAEKKNRVGCHLSTPWKPTNPDLAPDGVACLIPKSPLKPGTTYTAVAENLPKNQRLVWTFKTGR